MDYLKHIISTKDYCSLAGFECHCFDGFEVADKVCVDVDECRNNNPCGRGTCRNVAGSYDCECQHGFQVRHSLFCELKVLNNM